MSAVYRVVAHVLAADADRALAAVGRVPDALAVSAEPVMIRKSDGKEAPAESLAELEATGRYGLPNKAPPAKGEAA